MADDVLVGNESGQANDYRVATSDIGGGTPEHVQWVHRPARSAAVTTANQSDSTGTLLAAHATNQRARLRMYNDSEGHAAALHYKLGANASLSDFTDVILPGQCHVIEGYQGEVSGIWTAAGTGKARLTEEVL